MTLVLGVDGGGRKTYAVVADEHGEVLGTGEAGASNWEIAGADGASGADRVGGRRRASAKRRATAIAAAGVRSGRTRLGVRRTPADGAVADVTPGAPRRLVNDAFIALRAGDVGVVGDRGDRRHRHGRGRPRPGRQRVPHDRRGPGVRRLRRRVRRVGARRPCGRRSLHGPQARRRCSPTCCASGSGSRPSRRCSSSSRDTTRRLRAPELQNLTPMVLAATEAGDLVARTVLERIGEALGEAAGVVARRLNLIEPSRRGGARRGALPDAEPVSPGRARVGRAAHGAAGGGPIAHRAPCRRRGADGVGTRQGADHEQRLVARARRGHEAVLGRARELSATRRARAGRRDGRGSSTSATSGTSCGRRGRRT